jgi:hypothetical protein
LPSAASENIVSINVSNEDGETAVTSFPTDEHLPATEKNATLLNLTQRHPDATIDDDPGHLALRSEVESGQPRTRATIARLLAEVARASAAIRHPSNAPPRRIYSSVITSDHRLRRVGTAQGCRTPSRVIIAVGPDRPASSARDGWRGG